MEVLNVECWELLHFFPMPNIIHQSHCTNTNALEIFRNFLSAWLDYNLQ